MDLIKDTIAMDRFRKSLSYKVAVGDNQVSGQNIFNISIDTDGQVIEYPEPSAELNNDLRRSNGELGVPLYIVDNTARTVYPPEFALIGDANISLKASTTNALAPDRLYWLEIDTTESFDSPLKTRIEQSQAGGVLKWTPAINWQDSTTYYWRVSPAVSAETPEPIWSNSSFTYVGGSPAGWHQGHYWQLKKNNQLGLLFKDSSLQIDFRFKLLDMRVRNKIWEIDDRPGFFYNNSNAAGSVRPWQYIDQGVGVMVFIPETGVNWRNTGRQFGSVDGNNQSVFSFDTRSAENREALIPDVNRRNTGQLYCFCFYITGYSGGRLRPARMGK